MTARARTAVAVLLFAGAVTACGSGAGTDSSAEPEPTALEAAYDVCGPRVEEAMASAYGEDAPDVDDLISLEDDGTSIIVSTPEPGGELMSASAIVATKCVLEETDAPATIFASMGTTTAMSGRQSESYDDIDVDWSYAAGYDAAGFNATFTQT